MNASPLTMTAKTKRLAIIDMIQIIVLASLCVVLVTTGIMWVRFMHDPLN